MKTPAVSDLLTMLVRCGRTTGKHNFYRCVGIESRMDDLLDDYIIRCYSSSCVINKSFSSLYGGTESSVKHGETLDLSRKA